ncbi:hypothetical protein ACFSC3_02710 [Sphingomonas floccifaciens]|uniref:Type II CBASS E2 protein domain-containing protein n=1 Tax=Sphingomonas floccifaciens TaxID=1844115 RepID=A0ABW4N922_9SPHN
MIADVGSSWSAPLCTAGSTGWRPRVARFFADMQIRAMTERFPTLKVVLDLLWVTIWEGELTPLSQPYRVRIVDHRGMDDGSFRFTSPWPSARLLTPIARRPEAPDLPIPHIYGPHDDPRGADLCLFHPRSRDWTDDMLLAESIVPWTAEWLFYYEMWLVTGLWGGDEAEHGAVPVTRQGSTRRGRAASPRPHIDAPVMRSFAYLLKD